MNATLPHGLITIGHASVSDDSSSQYYDVLFERMNVLHTFWKVHAVRHKVSKDAADFRSQNLFWRTRGDPRLSKTITTSTLTSLWSSCQQRFDAVSLRQTIDLPPFDSNQIFSKHTWPAPRDKSAIPTSELLSTSHTSSNQGSPTSQKPSARRTSVDEGNGLGITIDGNRKSARASRPALYRANSSSNRTSYTALTTKAKSRPSLSRRKSSQGGMPAKATKSVKTPAKSPNPSSKEVERVDVLPPTPTTSTFELPSASSWEDDPIMDLSRLSNSNSNANTPSELVEPNFRHRFAERVASSSNLAGVNRIKKTGSVVRFADEIPTDFPKVRMNESGSFVESERRSSLSHRGSTASISSVAVIDEDDTLSSGLPRTKSQLSMMIAETRSQRSRQPTESVPVGEHVGLSSRRKRDPTDYEKILAMAHNDGVTKAGGRQIRRGFKMSDEGESRYSSPSPPPLF